MSRYTVLQMAPQREPLVPQPQAAAQPIPGQRTRETRPVLRVQVPVDQPRYFGGYEIPEYLQSIRVILLAILIVVYILVSAHLVVQIFNVLKNDCHQSIMMEVKIPLACVPTAIDYKETEFPVPGQDCILEPQAGPAELIPWEEMPLLSFEENFCYRQNLTYFTRKISNQEIIGVKRMYNYRCESRIPATLTIVLPQLCEDRGQDILRYVQVEASTSDSICSRILSKAELDQFEMEMKNIRPTAMKIE